MIKTALSFLIIFFGLSTLAVTRAGLPGYIIKSDERSADVPQGTCVVTGKIFLDSEPAKGFEIGTLNRQSNGFSKADGTYRIQVNVGDTAIFAYKEGVGEEVVWNHNFKSQHVVEIDFYFNSEKTPVVTFKPVIYFYSDESVNASISIDPLCELTFTYPEYREGWGVEVQGSSIKVDDKSYPYLFWEGDNHDYQYLEKDGVVEASVVHRSDLISFFESNLTALGLNETEQTDLITFWLPRLIEKEHTMIQFLVDTDYETYVSKMQIKPKPVSMRRVFLLCTPLDSPDIGFDLIPQKFVAFERNGFTVVEWGGSIIDIETITP